MAGFCGEMQSQLTGLNNVGSETINGISTTKYSATIEADGDPSIDGPHDLRSEFWVDAQGRLVRHKKTLIYGDITGQTNFLN